MNQLSFLSAFLLMLTSSTCLLDSVQAQTHLRGLQLASGWQRQMLTAVNAERSKAGLSPLCMNKKLQTAAALHSKDMAKNNFMSHTGSSGSTMVSRINAQKFKWNSLGENVAAGQVSVAEVVKAWMKSPGHRANILGKYKFFGAGYSFNSGATYKHYWTQDFGNSATEACS